MIAGLKIKLKRIERGYKQYQFARDLGISREYLRRIENGTAKNPSIELMKKISLILESSPEELFFS